MLSYEVPEVERQSREREILLPLTPFNFLTFSIRGNFHRTYFNQSSRLHYFLWFSLFVLFVLEVFWWTCSLARWSYLARRLSFERWPLFLSLQFWMFPLDVRGLPIAPFNVLSLALRVESGLSGYGPSWMGVLYCTVQSCANSKDSTSTYSTIHTSVCCSGLYCTLLHRQQYCTVLLVLSAVL
jgi:hypothetical protein